MKAEWLPSQLKRRSATTWLRYGQLGLVAFILDGYAPTIQLIANDLNIPVSIASLHGTAFGVGFIAGAKAASILTARVGRNKAITIGLFSLAVALTIYLLSPLFVGTLVGLGISGLACSVVQSVSYADLADSRVKVRRRLLTEGAAVSQLAGISAPLLIGLATTLVVGWRAGLAVAVLVSIGFLAASAITGNSKQVPKSSNTNMRAKREPLRVKFWVSWVSMMTVLGIEFCMSMWVPVYLLEQTGQSKWLSTLSPAIMLTGIFVGRLAVSRLANRFTADHLLYSAVSLCLVGFATFWLPSLLIVSLVGLFIVGLGISAQFPLSLARLTALADNQPDLASAYGSLALGMAIAVTPFLLGQLDYYVGVQLGLLLVPVLAIASLIFLSSSRSSA